MKIANHIACTATLLVINASTLTLVAEPSDEVRRAFVNLRDDNTKHNCGEAELWLYPRREQLKDDLLDELYRTDDQAASAIMFILFNVQSLKPDERFINTVINSVSRGSRYYIGAGALFDTPTKEPDQIRTTWEYIDAHFDIFEPLLTRQISITSDPWVLWAMAWEFKSRKTLDQKIDLFTPEVMKKAAASLVDDKIASNASQAIRLFLLLGDRSIPCLKEAAQSSDRQAQSFARATLDALKGNRHAFGYLVTKVDLEHELLTFPGINGPENPPWLFDEVQPYENENPYP